MMIRTRKKEQEVKTARRIILICLVSWFLTPGSIMSQVLYRISGNSAAAPSYILATNRMVDMQFIDTIPNAFKCYATSEDLIIEAMRRMKEALAKLV